MRAQQTEGFQVWIAAGAGPVLYPRAGGYRFIGLDSGAFVFRSGFGVEQRRYPQPVTPPLPTRAAA